MPQVATVDGQPLLLFSCMPQDLAANRRVPAPPGGVWTARGVSELGPFDIDSGATAFDHPSLYSGRLIRDRDQQWVLLGFLNHEPGEAFIGEISDPIPVGYQPGKGLVHTQRGSETGKLIHAR